MTVNHLPCSVLHSLKIIQLLWVSCVVKTPAVGQSHILNVPRIIIEWRGHPLRSRAKSFMSPSPFFAHRNNRTSRIRLFVSECDSWKRNHPPCQGLLCVTRAFWRKLCDWAFFQRNARKLASLCKLKTFQLHIDFMLTLRPLTEHAWLVGFSNGSPSRKQNRRTKRLLNWSGAWHRMDGMPFSIVDG